MVALRQVGGAVPRFPTRLAKGDFNITANVVVQPAGFGRVGYLTVGKQQLVTFGSTGAKAGGAEGEPLFIDLRSTADAVIDGRVRLSIYDANDRLVKVVREERTERLRASQNDRNSAPLLPEFSFFAPEDMKLVIEFYPDSATAVTLGYASTNFFTLVPMTKIFL